MNRVNKKLLLFLDSAVGISVLVFFLALGLRFLYLAASVELNLFPDLFLDSLYYQKIADRIHSGLGAGNHPYLLSPLYPYLLSPFISGESLDAHLVRVIQSILGALTCVFCALITLRLSGVKTAYFSGVMAAIYGPLIHYDQTILVASTQAFTMTLSLYCLLNGEMGNRKSIWYLCAGLALGLSCALRPTGLLLVIACTGLLVLQAIWLKDKEALSKKLFPFIVAVCLMVSPFTIRNYQVSGEKVLLSANGGMNFWIGNHKNSHGVFNLPPEYDLVHDPLGVDVASKRAGEKLTYTESSSWWREQAVKDIVESPQRWLNLMGKKVLLFAHPYEIPQLGLNFQWYQKKTVWLQLSPFNAMHFIFLGLLAPLCLYLAREQGSARLSFWPIAWLIVYWVGISLFFVTGRYRAPIMPIVIALSAVSIGTLLRLVIQPKQNLTYVVVPVGLFVLAVLIGNKLYDSDRLLPRVNFLSGTEERQQGMALYKQGKFIQAEEAYRRSLLVRDNSITRGNLANALKAQGKIEEALHEYERVLQANPKDAVVLYNLANLYRDHKKDLITAITLYEKAVDVQPRFYQAYLNLGLLYGRLGKVTQAREALQNYLKHAPENDSAREGVIATLVRLNLS